MDDTPRSSSDYRSTVRRAAAAEAHDALAIVRESAAWAAEHGIEVWAAHELRAETYRRAAGQSELVIGYADATPAATMLLQREDPLYWPEAAPCSALYLHKVAIRRAFAGQSWLGRLIDFAVADALDNGIRRLRLDTILRPKLKAMYERHGFRVLAEEPLVMAGRRMIRMERVLNSDAVTGR